jgi:hypothetical protein
MEALLAFVDRNEGALLIGATLVLVIGCSGPGTSSPHSVAAQPSDTTESSAEPAGSEPAPAEAPVTITGSGIESSAPFHLDGGVYLVEWTATFNSGSDGCYHGADLKAVDPDVLMVEPLASELLDSGDPMEGTTYVYDLARGDYYVRASSGCDWSFTFTAQ